MVSLIDSTYRAETIWLDHSFKPWMKLDKPLKLCKVTRDLNRHHFEIYKTIEAFVAEHEMDFQQKKTSSPRKPNPFLDLHYSLRHTMTYQQNLESFLMFFAAGFDTTGKALSSVLLLLAMNPQEQEKVHDEISSILTSEFDELDEEKLAKMDYLDLVIKESLRLIPQALSFARETTEDVQLSE
jgi:cytochrome P450